MKVYIGPYKNWFGPYQIARMILFWKNKHDLSVWKLTDWLSENRKGENTWLFNLCIWFDNKRKRKVKVRIDPYDTWNIDHTLAHIIVPMLKQLRENKAGSQLVEDHDVPEELRSTNAAIPAPENEVDDNWHRRWDWVLGEMIFAFESKLYDWHEEYYTNEDEPDWEKYEAYQSRITNGFLLFGKYYEGLWD